MWFQKLFKKTDQSTLPPWERDGYKVLGSYDASQQAEGDRLVLEALKSHGADLSRSRHVIHYLYFPSAEARECAEQKLIQAQYVTRFGVTADDQTTACPYSLIAERTGLVDDARMATERSFLTQIAEAGDGEYNGWEAALD